MRDRRTGFLTDCDPGWVSASARGSGLDHRSFLSARGEKAIFGERQSGVVTVTVSDPRGVCGFSTACDCGLGRVTAAPATAYVKASVAVVD